MRSRSLKTNIFYRLSIGSGEDDGGVTSEPQKKKSKKTRTGGDDDSSLSSDTKNLRANNNLDRNVRWHNQRMLEENKKSEVDNGPKDDVTGASVTANNATARLSSLEHCPKAPRNKELEEPTAAYESPGDQSSDDSLLAGVEEKKKGEDASDDSGYRESNDSREESSSSWSDTSRSNGKSQKFLFAPFLLWLHYIFSHYVFVKYNRSSKETSCSNLSNVSDS